MKNLRIALGVVFGAGCVGLASLVTVPAAVNQAAA